MPNINDLPDAQASLYDRPRQTFGNDEGADLTIQCKNSVWRVHQEFVCPKSSHLAALCASASTNGSACSITLDEDPWAIGALLHYLHENHYFDRPFSTGTDLLTINLLVHDLANRYNIHSLAKLAVKTFHSRAEFEWRTVAFAKAAQRVFTAGLSADFDDELRAAVVEVALAHEEVLTGKGFGQRFYEVVHATPALEEAITMEQAKRSSGGKRKSSEEVVNEGRKEGGKWYYCNNCNSTESEGDILAATGWYHRCVVCEVGYEQEVWYTRPAADLSSKRRRR
ncbi:hypothetical protein LTR56_008597 [Elasticomyces elasticus]|nr:hypothetical protein LTR56_008597 [Elasticomyces elasticus]KAK3662203.1 hypothetical protein LTR22_006968 [Elasticomyces elasticus]KAK4916181.1 hypothetical protein LTR49_015822 [Elasticomyces elasticus]KAK5767966.1 hypothetical protein LTS12_001783 [Elasticomyces elasticus]